MRHIRTMRLQRGWTLDFVAQKAGITKSAYCHIEAGRRGASTSVWDRLEDLFGIDQRELREIKPESAEEVRITFVPERRFYQPDNQD